MFTIAFPVGAVLAAILVLVPSPAHWRARNVATIALITWIFLMNVIYTVNSLVWSSNSLPQRLVWCDITTKLQIGASSAIPACTLCICKYLETVTSGRVARLTSDDHRRRRLFELIMCIGVPVALMLFHFVVQDHRFDIVESIGCQPATYYSVPAVFIVWLPPLLLSAITFVYAALALYHFFRQHVNFPTHLENCGSDLNMNKYFRLMAMSLAEIIWGTSITAVIIYANISSGLRPWTNWAVVHSDFGRIDSYQLSMMPHPLLKQIFVMWWAIPASAYIFFLFFAFSEDTMRDYKCAYTWVKTAVFKRPEVLRKIRFGPFKGFDSLPPKLIVHKQSTLDFKSDCNDETLPSYTPRPRNSAPFVTPTSSKFSSFHPSSPTFSIPSTLGTSKDTDTDLEKNTNFITVHLQHSIRNSQLLSLPTPLTPQSPFSVSSRCSALSRDSRISISEEFPPSRPPTPPPAVVTRERRQYDWRLSFQRSPTSKYPSPISPERR